MSRTKYLLNPYRRITLLSLILTFILFCIPLASADSVVCISPSGQDIYANHDFDVFINIEPETPIAGAQLDISFDNDMITANRVDDGGFFKQEGIMSIFIGGTIDNPHGRINGLFAVTLGKAEVSTPENFAHVTFTASNKTGNCIISLSNVIMSDSDGKAIPVTVSNAQVNIIETSASLIQESIASSGGGSGGGGGGDTGENTENIDFMEVEKLYVTGDYDVVYLFDENTNPVRSISYRSLKNAGFITSTIEVLKDVSSTVSEKPDGIIYRNMNIWVGKAGYATENNIEDTRISFIVLKKWMQSNDIGTGNIHMKRYSDGKWEKLDTEMTGENEDFILYEAKTPGFSPFAITADVPYENPMEKVISNSDTDNKVLLPEEENSLDTKSPASVVSDTNSAKLAQNSLLLFCPSIFIILLCRRCRFI
ncbi:PGF-pre-PGF domain-containing protein [Methanolobus psychrotolerans]|uniref:PGF-pre-PGF domain-containing protein n=1 Tax=Methanolobus psychrotolerans TaxID=1874706 RepID=UPI0013EB6521|nr:PGF-pre-PGF domain-containing protein [Methanolobus psychrotolerans]